MFPLTITIHDRTQLSAVLAALDADVIPASAQKAVAAAASMAADAARHAARQEATPAGKSGTAATKPAASASSSITAEAAAADVSKHKPEPSEADTAQDAAAPSASADAGATSGAEEVSYDEIKPLILKLVRTDRDAAVKILAGFGAKTGTELKAEQYAEAKEQLEAALAA